MLEFPGQVLELSMSVGRGTKGSPRPPMGSGMVDNDYLNLRALLRAIFDIISSSGRSFSYGLGTLRRSFVKIYCYRISYKTTGRIFV